MLFRAALIGLRIVTVRDTAMRAVLAERMAKSGPDGPPRWLAAEHQRASDLVEYNIIPWFMREPPPVFAAAPENASRIRFVAFGDWGRRNNENQQQVAAAMRAAHARARFDFGVTTGDNFYSDGIESPRSSRWQPEYEQEYGVMGIPIYATLGNHDFEDPESPAAQIAYTGFSKTWKLPATHYTFTAGPAQFFMLDTQSLTPWQLGWLDSALAASTARWKIVVGHYDLYSNRRDERSQGAVPLLVPILKRHRVPVYVNGHYHTLQHYQVDGTDYITTGAGGGSRLYGVDTTKVEPARKFAAASYGFAEIDVTPTTFVLRFRDASGKEIYRYERRQ